MENMLPYVFSADFISVVSMVWRVYLKPLQGRSGVRILEIGSFEGRSAIWFLENILTGEGSSITCVDGFWAPYGEVFDRNIEASGQSHRVVKRTGLSTEVLPTLGAEEYDVVYIDGGHRENEVWQDALQAWRVAKQDAIVIFDDYLWCLELPPSERPQPAIDRFLKVYDGQYRTLSRGYQILIQKLGGSDRG